MIWEKTVMSDERLGKIFGQPACAKVTCKKCFNKCDEVAEAQAELTWDIAFKAGYDEGLADGGVIGHEQALKGGSK